MSPRVSQLIHLLASLFLRPILNRKDRFDRAWYLRQYPDVAAAKADPLTHYLLHGWKEGREPGPDFDSDSYLSASSGKKIRIAPLLHYVFIGRPYGVRAANEPDNDVWWWNLRSRSITLASPYAMRAVATTEWPVIAVPVFNAADSLGQCLCSLAQYTPDQCEILIIDDASTCISVQALLSVYEDMPQFRVVRHDINRGYTATVNEAIHLARPKDVILLNSDTQVGPGWVKQMRWRALSAPKVGTVTAISNNSGAFSAPKPGFNELPPHRPIPTVIRAVAQGVPSSVIDVPTGNGFCMYIRRRYLDEIGVFDVARFPRGYGEENDLCMRGRDAGWQHLIDSKTYVIHQRSASFGEEKNSLMTAGRAVVETRYPEYSRLVSEAFKSPALIEMRKAVGSVFRSMSRPDVRVQPRVLYVIGSRTGGTPQTNEDLMTALQGVIEALVLQCNSSEMTFYFYSSGRYIRINSHALASPILATDHFSAEYDQILAQFLMSWNVELVHLRHVALHSLGLPRVCNQCGIPVLCSFHDFYTVCPSVKLVDHDLVFCGGRCTPGTGSCKPELWPSDSFSALKHDQVNDWQAKFAEFLDYCDAFITTSCLTKEVHLSIYPLLESKSFHVIPHGRDFESFSELAVRPDRGEPIRLVIPGNLDERKGAHLVTGLAELVSPQELEIHLLGKIGSRVQLPDHVIQHGRYVRGQFSERIRSISPAIGGILSIWPETWCHTLTELWACGVPVLGIDTGAVGDRIRDTEAGWVVPIDQGNPEVLWRSIQNAVTEHEWQSKVNAVRQWQQGMGSKQSTAWMAEQYLGIYRQWTKIDALGSDNPRVETKRAARSE